MQFKKITGVIFDMDGTLVDSEINTERSVKELLAKHRLSGEDIDYTCYHGITWQSIERDLQNRFPALKGVEVAEELEKTFHHLFVHENPPFIEGADDFFLLCCRSLPTAIATSSNREDLEYLINRIGARKTLTAAVSAENYRHSKPDPECYLLAAEKLGCKPENCLVFEDSIAGLTAAKRAGMSTVAIMKHRDDEGEVKGIADLKITDYRELSAGFIDEIRKEEG